MKIEVSSQHNQVFFPEPCYSFSCVFTYNNEEFQ